MILFAIKEFALPITFILIGYCVLEKFLYGRAIKETLLETIKIFAFVIFLMFLFIFKGLVENKPLLRHIFIVVLGIIFLFIVGFIMKTLWEAFCSVIDSDKVKNKISETVNKTKDLIRSFVKWYKIETYKNTILLLLGVIAICLVKIAFN